MCFRPDENNRILLHPVIVCIKKVKFNDTQNENQYINGMQRESASSIWCTPGAVQAEPQVSANTARMWYIKVSSAASSDMVWRVSASWSDGSQSGLSNLHMAPYTPV